MDRKVKGILFVDYVRMIRRRKDVDWSRHLTKEDLAIASGTIQPSEWYPMDTFERMGLGILEEVAGGDVEGARLWGRVYMTNAFETQEGLIADGDPMECLMRFKVLERSFFSFDGIEITSLDANHAVLRICYHMSPRAEHASAYQTLGFFESLLERAGARGIAWEFEKKAWEGDEATVLVLGWESGPQPPGGGDVDAGSGGTPRTRSVLGRIRSSS